MRRETAEARLVAIAEVVERYCYSAPADPALLHPATFLQLDGDALDPEIVAPIAKEQRSASKSLHHEELYWSAAFSVTRGRSVLIPADLVSLDRGVCLPRGALGPRTSTGVAADVWLARAILRALQEVLERDALGIWWQARLPLIRLDASGTELDRTMAECAAAACAEFELYRVPTDGPFPVVVAIAWSESYPKAVVGSACRADAAAAAWKAFTEAASLFCSLRSFPPLVPSELPSPWSRAALYATSEGADTLRRELRQDDREQLGECSEEQLPTYGYALHAAVEAMSALGLEVIVRDITTRDAASAGWRVVRVLVPGVLDAVSDVSIAGAAAQRLRAVPVALGFRDAPPSSAELNVAPAPLS